MFFRSQEPRSLDSLLKSEEIKSHVVLPEESSAGRLPRPQGDECFSSNNKATGQRIRAEPASCGRLETGTSQVSVVEENNCTKCVAKYAEGYKEELEITYQENDQNLKEPTVKRAVRPRASILKVRELGLFVVYTMEH